MKKHLTNDDLSHIVDQTVDLASVLRDAANKVDADKVDTIDNVWSQVAALQLIITDSSDLARKLILRACMQQQEADLAKLKDDQQ